MLVYKVFEKILVVCINKFHLLINMKNKTLPTLWIIGLYLAVLFWLIIMSSEISGEYETFFFAAGSLELLFLFGAILNIVFAILMMLRIWKLDACKTSVKIWLLGVASILTGFLVSIYNGEGDGLSGLLIFGGMLACFVCLVRASYLLYKNPI